MTWQHLSEDIAEIFAEHEPDLELAYLEWGAGLEAEHRETNRQFASDKVHTNPLHAMSEQYRYKAQRARESVPPEQAVLLATEPVSHQELARRDYEAASERRIRVVPPARVATEPEPEMRQAFLKLGRCG